MRRLTALAALLLAGCVYYSDDRPRVDPNDPGRAAEQQRLNERTVACEEVPNEPDAPCGTWTFAWCRRADGKYELALVSRNRSAKCVAEDGVCQ